MAMANPPVVVVPLAAPAPKKMKALNRFQLRRQIPASWRVAGTAATLAVIALVGAVRIGVSPPPLSPPAGSGLLEAAAGNDTGGYNARLSCWDAAADRKMGAGWFIAYTVLILYLFVGMAIICDDYFGQCLEIIAMKLNLSEDVAGATFLAAGSSTPELFMAIAGAVFGSDVGIGTIVGSAVFNISIIIGLSALFVPERDGKDGAKIRALQIDWRPLFRDLVFYTLAITMLLVFFVGPTEESKDVVEVWESGLLVFGYCAYVVFMRYNSAILRKCCGGGGAVATADDDQASDVGPRVDRDRADSDVDLLKTGGDQAAAGDEGGDRPFYKPPEGGLAAKAGWCIVFPLRTLFVLTVPPCNAEDGDKNPWNKYYPLQFVMSIFHITWLSYFMHECAVRMGCIIGLPIAIMGLTVLAIGTSVPDALGSVFATMEGKGDMAVSNAIGSNVFDILLCLGAPWFVKSLAGSTVTVGTTGILNYAIALYGMMLLVVGTMALAKWKLSRPVGAIMFFLYFIYIIMALTVLMPK